MTWLRLLSIGCAILAATAAGAADRVTRFGPADAKEQLAVWSATDLAELLPAIEGFLAANPGIAITYRDMQTVALYENIKAGKPAAPDLVISSATDLQIKLANDGFAREHVVKGATLPSWASWRNRAFGISVEPAVTVFHQSFTRIAPIPRSRPELAAILADSAAELHGRVGTYDIEQSGIGYLFASQDSLYGTTYTTLLQALGRVHGRTFCCSGEILDEIEKQRLLVGYNVIGSYALARKKAGAPIEIVLPDDYTLLLSRVALIPKDAKRPDLSGAFLNYLLSPAGQKLLAGLTSYPLDSAMVSHPIALNASLLVYLDPVKRSKFIKAWRSLIGSSGN